MDKADIRKDLGHFWPGYIKDAGTPANECSLSEGCELGSIHTGSMLIPDMLQNLMLFGYRHYVNRKCPTSFIEED